MEFLYPLALLACPVGMGLMMWFMAKGMKGGDQKKAPSSPDDLRAEQQRIAEQLDRIERQNGAAARGDLVAP